MKYIFLNVFVFNFSFKWACENKAKWHISEQPYSLYITFTFSWTVLIIKNFHETTFCLLLVTAVLDILMKEKKKTLHLPCISPLVIFLCKMCLLGQTKQGCILLIIFQLPDVPPTSLIIFYIFHKNFQRPAY